jgi:hypothetical protein
MQLVSTQKTHTSLKHSFTQWNNHIKTIENLYVYKYNQLATYEA